MRLAGPPFRAPRAPRARRLLLALVTTLATVLALGAGTGSAQAAVKPPSSLAVRAKAPTSLTLGWKAVSKAPAYRVKYSTSSSFSRPRYREVAATSTTLAGLKPQTTYYVKVRVVSRVGKSKGLSGYGAVVKVTTPAAAKPLRVGSYNVRCASCYVAGIPEEGTWEQRRAAVVNTIKGEDLDVLGVQEASQGWLRDASGKKFSLSQFEDLVNRLGGGWKLANTKRNNCVKDTTPSGCVYRDQGASLGTRILYNSNRVKLIANGSRLLPETNEAGTRHYLAWAQLQQLSTGRKFMLADVHLTAYAENHQLRMVQSRVALAEVKAKGSNLPVIAVGDWNSGKWDQPTNAPYDVWTGGGLVDPLGNSYGSSGLRTTAPQVEKRVNTWLNSFNGFRRHATGHPTWTNGTYIDYIFTSPMRVSEWETVANLDTAGNFIGQIPSDHNLVRATVWLPI